MKIFKNVARREKFSAGGATASGISGALGSLPNVCHSVCMTIVSLLAVFGITLSVLPLMFVQTYGLYFWLTALGFTVLSVLFFVNQKRKAHWERNLLLINIGLLIFGIPFVSTADFSDFFRFLGGSIVLLGLIMSVFGKKLSAMLINPDEVATIYSEQDYARVRRDNLSVAPGVSSVSLFKFKKMEIPRLLFIIVIAGFLVNQYLIYQMNLPGKLNLPVLSPVGSTGTTMKLSVFDTALAKERMDKNNDGICDVCGMPVQQCIDSGQIDCNMGSNPQAIGTLGTAHNHADLNVYVSGQLLDLAKPEYYMKSSLLHLDDNQNKQDASSVLHMHAKQVPLWLFFRSVGMNLTKESLTLADGRMLKNEDGNTLKFYLNGKKIDSLEDYSFQPLDKLLISYGPENDLDIQSQISSVTNFSKDHQK